jgi:hypothetical protein
MAVTDNLPAPDPLIDYLYRPAQEGKGRPRGIQSPKPAMEGGRSRHTMGIFHRRRRRFPGTALHKVEPQRGTAGDQAVMGIGERKHGQEGDRLTASSAEAAPNFNPIMVFIMGLFAPTAMADDRIARANRATTNNYFCSSLRPIGSPLIVRAGT